MGDGFYRGQLPQRAGSLGLNGGGAAAAVPPEHQSAQMSKTTNDSLTWSSTGCFIAIPIWSGRHRVKIKLLLDGQHRQLGFSSRKKQQIVVQRVHL